MAISNIKSLTEKFKASQGIATKKETEARTGRNPQTGEALEIAASKRLGFKAARGLKDAITATV